MLRWFSFPRTLELLDLHEEIVEPGSVGTSPAPRSLGPLHGVARLLFGDFKAGTDQSF